MNNTIKLAKELQAQLDNINITNEIKKNHAGKLSILINCLDKIINDNLVNIRIDGYLEIILKNTVSKTDIYLGIDKVIKNINLLNNVLNSNASNTYKTENVKVIKQKNTILPFIDIDNNASNLKVGDVKLEDTFKTFIDIDDNQPLVNATIQSIEDVKSKDTVIPSLNVIQLAKVMAESIKGLNVESGEMVGIFGKWGRGKTYLANKIKDELEKDNNEVSYKWIYFSAWKYSDTKQTWAYIFKTFIDSYLDNKNELWYEKYFFLIGRLPKILWYKYGFAKFLILLISIVGIICAVIKVDESLNFSEPLWEYTEILYVIGIIGLIKIIYFVFKYKDGAKYIIDKYISREHYKEILGLQAEVENEIAIILKAWVDGENEKVVLFVDDLDRANIKNMIQILDSLRIILDNEEIYKRLIIITAIDDKLLEQSFFTKYSDFGKTDALFKEYLQKIFIFGINLHDIENNEIEEFTKKLIGFDKLSKNENAKKNRNTTQSTKEIGKTKTDTSSNRINNDEMKEKEKEKIIECMKDLNNATPRRIRIFYYKYILLKKLVTIDGKNKDADTLLKELIAVENNKEIANDNLAKMVSLP